jgi:hypothetical protein
LEIYVTVVRIMQYALSRLDDAFEILSMLENFP